MVRLDHQLVFNAQRFITGANVHRLGEMILLYKLAVGLHNSGHPEYLHYETRYEQELRQFVHEERIRMIAVNTRTVVH